MSFNTYKSTGVCIYIKGFAVEITERALEYKQQTRLLTQNNKFSLHSLGRLPRRLRLPIYASLQTLSPLSRARGSPPPAPAASARPHTTSCMYIYIYIDCFVLITPGPDIHTTGK